MTPKTYVTSRCCILTSFILVLTGSPAINKVAHAHGPSANASAVFHAKDEALQLAFHAADRIEERTVILTDEQKIAVEKLARAPVETQLWTLYLGWRGKECLGFAVIDTHLVRAAPATVMVVLSPSGAVGRVELLAFYDAANLLPPKEWSRQFEGRKIGDDLEVGSGIRGIAGSAAGANAVASSVRRVLALHNVLQTQESLPRG